MLTVVSTVAQKLGATAVGTTTRDASSWSQQFDALVYDEEQVGGDTIEWFETIPSVLVDRESLREWKSNELEADLERRLSHALQP